MSDGATLVGRMRALADSGHPRAEELREKADELQAKAEGFYGEPQTVPVKSFVGAWARAKRLMHDVTGEPLI